MSIDAYPLAALVLILAATLAIRFLLDRVFYNFLSAHEDDAKLAG